MRALILSTILLVGCAPELTIEDTCDEAQSRFIDCGTFLPFLTERPCTGLSLALADCIVRLESECSALADRPERCFYDVFGDAPAGTDFDPFQPEEAE